LPILRRLWPFVIAQVILLLGFIILPTDTHSFIELEIIAGQYIR
jgi:hypothetical protein